MGNHQPVLQNVDAMI